MATSQNGWSVIASGTSPLLVTIPKIAGRVRAGDVATVLAYLVARFDAEVEDVDLGADDWGYAYRPIAGKTSGFSNHASGTAIDLNATRHPLGARGTFTPAQRAAIRRILSDLDGVVRWGGDYTARADEMHFEIVATAARVAAVAARIRGGQLVSNPIGGAGGGLPSVPTVTAPDPIEENDVGTIDANQWDTLNDKLDEIKALATSVPREVWREPITDPATGEVGVAEDRLAWMDRRVRDLTASAAGHAAALTALAAAQGLDPDAVRAAAEQGARDALADLTLTVKP
jgi:hypothetical protein